MVSYISWSAAVCPLGALTAGMACMGSTNIVFSLTDMFVVIEVCSFSTQTYKLQNA